MVSIPDPIVGLSTTSLHRGWNQHRNKHRRLCVCGHKRWQHMGLEGTACTHLGTCPCLRYREDEHPSRPPA